MSKEQNLEDKDKALHIGSVSGINITMDLLIQECKNYYSKPENCVGGSLHIVLDDENIEDEHIKWCKNYAKEKGDNEGVLLAELLLKATIQQREKLVSDYSSYCH